MLKQYEFTELEIPGVTAITPFVTEDSRGITFKDYSREAFFGHGIAFEPTEALCIFSRRNVMRGLHFQRDEPQAKLVRCITGHVWAAIVDLRKEKGTFGKWISVDLNPMTEVYIPGGCALGTLALEDSFISCKCNGVFRADLADGIRWNDSDLGIKWPLEQLEGEPIISEKDLLLQGFRAYAGSLC